MDMFSGLTSQMTNWMGKKQETGSGGEKPPSPTETTEEQTTTSPTSSIAQSQSGERKDSSPTKGTNRMEMFTSMKSQMTSWLGGAIKKGDDSAEVKAESKPESPTSEKSEKGSPEEQKDDDDSSATGGADSVPASDGEGTPTDEKGVGLEGVSTKAIAGAKSIGSFFFSAVNKAGKTVTEAGAKIKKTVEENSLLGEFNREQEAFIKEKRGKDGDAAVPPWVGYREEDALKEEILSLSTDRRNFVRSPPSGVHFEFDYESSYQVALATLAEDPNLEKMRFELVPKVINEETFWRNYFYRVSLIRQSNELSNMSQEGPQDSKDSSRASSMEDAKDEAKDAAIARHPDSPIHEFVSDSFQPSSKDVEEAQEGMKKLGLTKTEDEWERELQMELQDYEVVPGGNSSENEIEWEKEIQTVMDSEDADDLK